MVRNTLYLALLTAVLTVGCATSHPDQQSALASLAVEQKFLPNRCYKGIDTPEDLQPLTAAVNSAIAKIAMLPAPRKPIEVRSALMELFNTADEFATEDREEVYRYIVRIWRAAGLKAETGFFSKGDADVLPYPFGCQP